MIGEPTVQVWCDECDAESDPYNLTALAGNCWDMRNVESALKRDGWLVLGKETFCPECTEAMAP